MSQVVIDLPDSVKDRMEKIARKDGLSLGEVVVAALTQKLVFDEVDDRFERRAARGSATRALELLGKAPDVSPDDAD